MNHDREVAHGVPDFTGSHGEYVVLSIRGAPVVFAHPRFRLDSRVELGGNILGSRDHTAGDRQSESVLLPVLCRVQHHNGHCRLLLIP